MVRNLGRVGYSTVHSVLTSLVRGERARGKGKEGEGRKGRGGASGSGCGWGQGCC